MQLPVVQGIIDRRILVNYRVDLDVLARLIPEPFRPLDLGGVGLAGICLIRLRGIRPWFVPEALGIGSENAAHRIAVEWESAGQRQQGVYIPRRDTSLWLNAAAGGRLFPGEHHLADFDVVERCGYYHVAFTSRDRCAWVSVDGRQSDAWVGDSVFPTLDDASRFFQKGSLGYSATRYVGCYDALELRCQSWSVHSLSLDRVRSSWFDNPALFPAGSVALDSALLMHNIRHSWHQQGSLRAAPRAEHILAAC